MKQYNIEGSHLMKCQLCSGNLNYYAGSKRQNPYYAECKGCKIRYEVLYKHHNLFILTEVNNFNKTDNKLVA